MKTVSIPVLDDNIVTPYLTVGLRLFNALLGGASNTNIVGLYTNGVLTITNTDSAGTAEFTASSYNVNENAGYAIFPVIRPVAVPGYTDQVNTTLSAEHGWRPPAQPTVGGVSGAFQFAAGQTSTNFIVGITNLNSPLTPSLLFNLVLSNAIPTNGLGTLNVAQVNIHGSQGFNEPPGQPVTGYGAYGFNGPVSSLAQQGDGKLLVGGSFTTADGIERNDVARLNVNGSLDTTFSSYLPTAGANQLCAIRCLADQRFDPGGRAVHFHSTTARKTTLRVST